MQPRHSFDTSMPVFPNLTYSIRILPRRQIEWIIGPFEGARQGEAGQRIVRRSPCPEESCKTRRLEGRSSAHNRRHPLDPSFETPCFTSLLRMRGGGKPQK